MDLWVVAAAAGAGYAAKNFQNFSAHNKDNPLGSSIKYSQNHQSESKNFLQQLRDKTCPLRRLAEKSFVDDSFLELGNNSETADLLDNTNWGLDVISGNNDDCNLGLKSRLPSIFSTEEESKSRSSGGAKKCKFIRNRGCHCQVHPVKAFTSLDTCLDGQQCRRNGEGRDDSACLYPPVSPVRPVLVTDWGGIVNWPVSPAEELQRTLRKSWSSGDFRLQDSGEGASSGSSSNSQGHGTMLLFVTGMVIGILTATIGWNNEVDKLNKLLKHMQSLIQDLQEELEMKEMLMVKELPNEGTVSPGECHEPLPVQEPIASPFDMKVNGLTKPETAEANDNYAENLELLSNIEAELQAELETLEQNINTSVMDRLSGVVELNLDFEPELVQGDLKPAMVDHPHESIDESTDTPTNCSQPANYSVSPWELSLRLHELIESRLEARIRELEATLSNSLDTVQVLDHESAMKFSHSGTDSSSDHEIPTCICDERDKREDGPSTEYSNDHENPYKAPNATLFGTAKHDRQIDWIQDILTSDKQMSTSFVSNHYSESDNDGANESDMLLIKQIVEKRKSGVKVEASKYC